MSTPPRVFHHAFSVERHAVKEVVRATLGAILFQRVLGTIRPRHVDVCGVSMPVPADSSIEGLLNDKAEAVARALSESARTRRQVRMYVSWYPTPVVPAPLPKSSSSASNGSKAVSGPGGALAWFSATARALAAEAEAAAATATDAGSSSSVPAEDASKRRIWEGWVLDWEIDTLPSGGGGGGGAGGGGNGEARLRNQLNDFVLRLLAFVTQHTQHVPPLSSPDKVPFAFVVHVEPESPPFIFGAAGSRTTAEPGATPLLREALKVPERQNARAYSSRY